MTCLAAISNPPAVEQIALAAVLGVVGFFLLLPRPRGRSMAGGIAAVIAALAVFGVWLCTVFGDPMSDFVGNVLFYLFSLGAVGFGTVMVVHRNPAHGAIAFAFVILSTSGLFLLLAAPFLMAATVIVYAGAIVVTFLFVLMLSQTTGPSDENDRSREPLMGSLAGFAFTGLVLFALYQGQAPAAAPEAADTPRSALLPAPVITAAERQQLREAADHLGRLTEDAFYGDPATAGTTHQERAAYRNDLEQKIEDVVGVSARKEEGTIREGSLPNRLAGLRSDLQATAVLERVRRVRDQNHNTMRAVDAALDTPQRGTPAAAEEQARTLRDEVLLLAGVGELPARNVGNLGTLLYADYLLAVELAGTLLLAATIGAVAIAHRKGATR